MWTKDGVQMGAICKGKAPDAVLTINKHCELWNEGGPVSLLQHQCDHERSKGRRRGCGGEDQPEEVAEDGEDSS